MRIPHYLTRTRAGYAFRLRVPAHLQPLLGCKVIKRSLRTTSRRAAQGAALFMACRYAQAFEDLQRGNAMTNSTDDNEHLIDLNAIVAMADEAFAQARFDARMKGAGNASTGHQLRELKMGLGPNGPFLETETGDSPEVIAQAMKTLETMMAAKGAAPVAAPTVAAIITAKEAQTRFLASIKPSALPKTYTIKKAAVEGFVEHYTKSDPKRQIAEVNRADVGDWVAFLRNAELATPTLVNKLSYLRGFFDFLIGAGFYPAGNNPAKGQAKFGAREKRLRRKLGFRPFTLEEIRILFAPEALERMGPEARWGALIGLYTGARVAEAGQLAVKDFWPQAAIPFYHFTDSGKGQRLKTDASDREIPIHSDLIKLGILERVEALKKAGDLRFFPDVETEGVNGAGNWLSKQFGRHLKRHGIVSEKEGAKVGFHSLRKTAIQAMQGWGVIADVRAQYVGHELEDEHRSVYSRRYTHEEMANVLFPALAYGLDLDGIKSTLGNPTRRRRQPEEGGVVDAL
jgi:integrase